MVVPACVHSSAIGTTLAFCFSRAAGKHNPAMGAANSHPAASELNFEGETSRFKYGVRCMQGRHQKMEDTFSAIADLDGTS